MHIPDGYLSPQTCAAAYAVAVPTWALAARRASEAVRVRNVPTLAVLSALSFLIMMFNVPVPGGMTAHAVGSVLIAIVLGPSAAIVATSVALLLQAVLFGDGGVLALGANALNVAVLMPLVGYGVYRVVRGTGQASRRRTVLAAALGGYLGINVAALAAAVELGVQPVLFHTANGVPLYSPYHLSQTVPVMMAAHLSLAGLAEAIVTGGAVGYLAATDPARLAAVGATAGPARPGVPAGTSADSARLGQAPRATRGGPVLGLSVRATAIVVGIMVLLTPLGLLAGGQAFGESAPADLDLGALGLAAVPEGLARYNGFWSDALLGGYGFAEGRHSTAGYLLSAVLGIIAIAVVTAVVAWFAERVLRRYRSGRATAGHAP